jgi:RHS repeat-associated protein
VYLGGDYEEVIPPIGGTHDRIQRVQVTAAERQIRRRNASTQTWEAAYYEYAHRDHLGSVDAITDGTGAVLQKTSFDPYGGRRATAWNADLSASGLDALRAWQDSRGSRGFTDHEHLNRTGFVHMNGRVYDPRIGRFVSPDPIVQAPWFSQSYNRYAYVFGSPVSYTDPSGYSCLGEGPCREPFRLDGFAVFGYCAGMVEWSMAFPSHHVFGGIGGVTIPELPVDIPMDLPRPPPPSGDGSTGGGSESESGTLFPPSGDVLGEAGRAAYYINLYVLGVDIRGSSDIVAGAPVAAITFVGGFPARVGIAAKGAASTVSAGSTFVATRGGTAVTIPEGWVGRVADNGKGVVYQRPGATGNADMIRIMDPTSRYPSGYVRYYNQHGQPLDVLGKPGLRDATHIPLDYQGPISGWPQ